MGHLEAFGGEFRIKTGTAKRVAAAKSCLPVTEKIKREAHPSGNYLDGTEPLIFLRVVSPVCSTGMP